MMKERSPKPILIFLALFVVFVFPAKLNAQEQVLATGIFRGSRVINGHSAESINQGELEFLIGHRFGRLNGGAYELFGLDQASIRLGLDYGIKNWLTIGIGRSSFEKTFDGFVKVRLLRQAEDGSMPLSITYLGTMAYRTLRDNDPVRDLYKSSRLFYTHQFLIAHKFSGRFSLQFMPTFVHRNYIATIEERNDILAAGIAARYRITKNLALTTESYFSMPNQLTEEYSNSISLGIEIETSGHVFQIHLTNSRGMIEKFFITETRGKWSNGDIHIGFNMNRIFKLKGRWY